MAGESAAERTEQATPKRLRDTREKGQIPRSRELSTVFILMSASLFILLYGSTMVTGLGEIMITGFTLDNQTLVNTSVMMKKMVDITLLAFRYFLPVIVVMMIVSLVAPVFIGGWNWSIAAIGFKWDRIDPIKGLGRIFSVRGLVELLKAIAKFFLVMSALLLLIWVIAVDLYNLGFGYVNQDIARSGAIIARSFIVISSVLILVALVDAPFQIWQHKRQLRMSRQEVKDELKETEGKPEIRQQIRKRQQAIAQSRMMQDLPGADVVIANPVHYAVAIKYDKEERGAPTIIAKGERLLAIRIREMAEGYGIPVLTAPPLARALYFNTDIGQEIPSGLYLAVARVLAYVYQFRDAAWNAVPPTEKDLPIPDHLNSKRNAR